MDLESQFWDLVQNANELDAKAFRILNDVNAESIDSNRMVEPTYLAICKLVTDHPAKRDIFVRCFSDLVLLKRKSPMMLVPFCMRLLRLPEIKIALQEEMNRLGSGTAAYANMMNYCSTLMHAYHDDVWENAIAFDTFEHELPGDSQR